MCRNSGRFIENRRRVLATSRESLGVEGERVFSLQSLAVPSAAWATLDVVKASEAVRLFVDRAQTVNREFALDAQSAPPVVEICRRLEGIAGRTVIVEPTLHGPVVGVGFYF
jgi:predicted ATPase